MDIILTLLALFPSLLQAGEQGTTSSAFIENSEIKQIIIQDDNSFKLNEDLEFTKEIIGLV